jgi:hypothetical protein
MEKGFKEFKVGDLVITPKAGGSKWTFVGRVRFVLLRSWEALVMVFGFAYR